MLPAHSTTLPGYAVAESGFDTPRGCTRVPALVRARRPRPGVVPNEVAVERAVSGEPRPSRPLNAVELPAALELLTARHCSARDIAYRLQISPRTVVRYRASSRSTASRVTARPQE